MKTKRAPSKPRKRRYDGNKVIPWESMAGLWLPKPLPMTDYETRVLAAMNAWVAENRRGDA